MRMKWRAASAVAAVAVVSGCTVTVGGSASPVPGQGPVVQVVDACSLLTPDQVDALGYKGAGRSIPANAEQRQAAMCLWNSRDDVEPSDVLNVGWATDLTLDDYLAGALAKSSPQQVGGLSWTQYASVLPNDCAFYTVLGEKSFAYVDVSGQELARSCQRATPILAQVASHLPGGQPAPSITPSTSAKPEPSGPLLSVDPCSLLKPEQVAQLANISPTGEKTVSNVVPNSSFCLWDDTDGSEGQKAFEIWLGPSTAAAQWPGVEGVPATETLGADGRNWGIFPNLGGLRVNCGAILPITDTSSVRIVSGFIGDDAKTCDLVKQGVPLVTANLPR